MIISMKSNATKEQIEHVCERIREFGFKVHSIVGDERVVIGAVGGAIRVKRVRFGDRKVDATAFAGGEGIAAGTRLG